MFYLLYKIASKKSLQPIKTYILDKSKLTLVSGIFSYGWAVLCINGWVPSRALHAHIQIGGQYFMGKPVRQTN